jgi:hypothetical protein
MAALLLIALATVACITPEAMGKMRGLQPDRMVTSPVPPQIAEAVAKAKTFGASLAGALAVLLGYLCWYRATQGESWVRLLGTYLGGLLVCAYVIASTGRALGIDQLMLKAGLELGEQFRPATREPLRGWSDGVRATGELVESLQEVTSGGLNREDDANLTAIAVAGFYASQVGALWLFINGAAVWLMALTLQVALAWLLAFYWVLTPLVAPTVILPSTRGIFIGWAKAYGSLCLWPCLFGIMERIADSLPWALFFGVIDTKTLNPILLADAVTQGVAMMFIGNLVFFFVYLAVPVAAWKLVNAVGQPFRGALG